MADCPECGADLYEVNLFCWGGDHTAHVSCSECDHTEKKEQIRYKQQLKRSI